MEMTSEKLDTLKDIVAFVDVWSSSKTENYSKPFIQQLQEMGAEVSKTFDKRVTHVVFKNGHQSTWNKAKKMGVKLVSVLWVARCKDCGERIDEELCPAINEESHRNPALNKRTHRCMQPRDIPVQSPENNKSMKRKLDRMMKNLVVSSPSSPDVSPFLFVEGSEIVYSPSSRRASDMARRLRVMREKRESLSRTDSYDDDSSDLDVSFNGFHSPFTSNKSEGEGQHSQKTPTFDLDTNRSSIEIKRSATEFLPRTDTEKQPFANHQAKKQTVERPGPQGLLSETIRAEPQNLTNSSIQRNEFECQKSLKSPCLDVLFGEGAITQSPIGLDSQDMRKRGKSSFKCDQAEKARSQSPRVMDLFGKSKSGPSAEIKHVLNTEGNDPCGRTKATEAHGLLRRSGSLSMSPSDSFSRKAAVAAVRKRDRYHKEPVSPLKAFCLRKTTLLAPNARGSPESPRVSTPTDDGAFENYFSPTNHAETGRRGRPLLLSLPSEPTPLPPIEEESKPRKRKRGRSEAVCPGPAKKTLVMTSMSIDWQDTVVQVVSSLGGFSLVDAVGDGTTHVVTGRPRRTLSVLLGIARGCWILSFEWILCCLEHRRWVSEEPYELSDHFPAASICRLQQHLSAGEHQQDLFSGQPAMFVSPQSQPPTCSLAELIQLCGGTVCKTVRQSGICIGQYKGKKPQGTRSLSEQWVLDCLTHLKELPYDSYDLDRKSV
ncbi:hypothetical protein SKAU_G00164210 [Synaphobranchus kaupii]|uniref:BRCT domain-containing protein n=1 Tax=Synaphobranchus kaupii TaxID=118154 RepID=A0A9Q1IZ65_SYNKA|nr:hypothetical protein SKAU_G00164210 [Synaphobranchus kaupii]